MEDKETQERRRQLDRRDQEEDRRFNVRATEAADANAQKAFLRKFETETDSRLRRFFLVCLLLNLGLGVYFTFVEIIIPDVLRPMLQEIQATADFKKLDEKKEEKKEEKKVVKKKGGGGPKKGKKTADINGIGVLKVISSKSKSSSHAAYDLMQSKFSDIEKSLEKIAGLKTTGQTRLAGRTGKNNAGFNEGYATGGTGGIDDMLGGLLGGDNVAVGVKAKGKLHAPSASEIDMGQGGSRRSAASILKVVRQHMPGLRHTYNKYLKKYPGFSGKVNIRFDIAPSGTVVSVAIASSTTGVGEFDSEVKDKVRRWRFEAITGTGNDIVTIPFTFSE